MNDNTINNENNAESMVEIRVLLSDLWRGLMKFWWIAAVLAVVLGGIQFYRSYIRFVPVYTSTATFTVHTENAVISGDNGASAYSFFYDRNTADQLANVFPYIVSSPILQQQICSELNVETMPAQVKATCVEGTNMITLTTTGSQPQMTYDVLISVMNNYSSVADYIIGQTRLVMISDPVVPDAPSNRFVWRTSVLTGIVIGLALGAAWIVLYAILRKTIRTKEDIRAILNQHCVGVLPQVIFKKYRRRINTDILLTNPLIGNEFLESLRLLRSSVKGGLAENEKMIVITSTAPDEGKSVVAVNLAAIFAKNDNRVLVIDGDIRNSGAEALLKYNLITATTVENNEFFKIRRINTLNFDLLSFNEGVENIQKIMRTSRIKSVLPGLKEKYDLILVDTPPCGMISDASIIAGAADAVLYVIRQDTVMQSSIRVGINSMLETEAKFLGCVLNGATGGPGGYGNYYSYGGYNKYYRYGYSRGYGYGEKKSGRKGRYGY